MIVSVEKMDELIHVIEEVELLNDAEFLVELKNPVPVDRTIEN